MLIKNKKGPYIHSGHKTHSYMAGLPGAYFGLLILSGLIHLFWYSSDVLFTVGPINVTLDMFGFYAALRVALIGMVSAVTATIVETVYYWQKGDVKDFDSWGRLMMSSYTSITPMILALTFPISTKLWVVAIASTVAVYIGKLIYGGFGKNIFNPALVGRLFVMMAFASDIGGDVQVWGWYSKLFNTIDTFSSATALTTLKGMGMIGFNGTVFNATEMTWGRLLGGLHYGGIGEVWPPFLIIGLLVFIKNRTADWRVPVTFLGTMFGMVWIIGWINGLGIWYPVYHIFTGGALFSAMFIITEPVSSPTTREGKVIFALIIAVITVMIRFIGNYPEGVTFAVLFANMMTPFINYNITSSGKMSKTKIASAIIAVALVLGISFVVGNQIKGDTGAEAHTLNITENVEVAA